MTVLAIFSAGYALFIVVLPDFRPRFVAKVFAISPVAGYFHLGFGFLAMLVGPFPIKQAIR